MSDSIFIMPEFTSGEQFERSIIHSLQNVGLTASKFTDEDGDHGIDIIASISLFGETLIYNIQCKYYNKTVGKIAVQEVYAGTHYICNGGIPVVMTSNYVTSAARKYAKRLGVEIISREEFEQINSKSGIVYTGLQGILAAKVKHDADYLKENYKATKKENNPDVPENKNELKLQIINDFDEAKEMEKEASRLEQRVSDFRIKAMDLQKAAIIRNLDYG